MTDITELAQRNELLIANGQQTADLLRHLADNEIDSDYFAVVSECESYGKETDAELSITEFALRAAGYVDALVEALEYYKSREERVTSLVRDNSKSWDELYRQVEAKGKRNVELVEALEKAQTKAIEQGRTACELFDEVTALRQRIAELESRTVKLPDGWQFEECEIEGCENGAIFSVGTGSRNIHLCDKCAHEPQNSRLKKSPLSKRLPLKMSAGIKVEAE
ncbi:hypothetical protein [Klebsiella pneumoniae]|uniref:hypothetical protein n=1 Tax=Klebsiella pneumoniae TaxID=573 RepID=UPI001EF7C323|nr:hypothetical protein [Klebsiella pneumoniae]